MSIAKYIFGLWVALNIGSSLISYPGSYRRLLMGEGQEQKVIDVVGHVTLEQEVRSSEPRSPIAAYEESLCRVIQTLDLDAVIKRTVLWSVPFSDGNHLLISPHTSVFLWDQGLAFREEEFKNIIFKNIDNRSLFISAVTDRLYNTKTGGKNYTFGHLIEKIDLNKKEYRDTDCIRSLYEKYAVSTMGDFALKLEELVSLIVSDKSRIDIHEESLPVLMQNSCMKLASFIKEQLGLLAEEFKKKDMTVEQWLVTITKSDATRINELLYRWAGFGPVVFQSLVEILLSDSSHIVVNLSIEHAIAVATCLREWCDAKEHLIIEASWPPSMRPTWSPIPLYEVNWVLISQNPSEQKQQILQSSNLFEKQYGIPKFVALIT